MLQLHLQEILFRLNVVLPKGDVKNHFGKGGALEMQISVENFLIVILVVFLLGMVTALSMTGGRYR